MKRAAVAVPAGIELLYVDEDIVVANKPSGLLVHRGWDDDEDVALFRVRDAIGAKVSPVHRLDRRTSGALLFSRTTEASSPLPPDSHPAPLPKLYLPPLPSPPPAPAA